jgi:hypothetical protein
MVDASPPAHGKRRATVATAICRATGRCHLISAPLEHAKVVALEQLLTQLRLIEILIFKTKLVFPGAQNTLNHCEVPK